MLFLNLAGRIFISMKDILVLGAGRSANVLIDYLEQQAIKLQLQVTVADASPELIAQKTGHLKAVQGLVLNIEEQAKLAALVAEHKITISLLPPPLHPLVAKMCVEYGRHLITASYLSAEMRQLDREARQKGIILLNECGLDPGIDHMSAMELFEEIHAKGGKITSFQSYCGGLVAPESDDNPFGYKISWNPRNVVLAGKGVSRYFADGRAMMVPYHRLFKRLKHFELPELGSFDGYPNRDSLSYMPLYGLEHCHTFIRGTLRKQGYCQAWHYLVQAGLTDDDVTFEMEAGQTYADLLMQLIEGPKAYLKQNFIEELAIDDPAVVKALEWLGIFSDQEALPITSGTMADFLQHLLLKKMTLNPNDKDMVVMIHEVGYTVEGKRFNTTAHFVRVGQNAHHTAMAETVGLPLAMAAILILLNKINEKGVLLPTKDEIWKPLWHELSNFGFAFKTNTLNIT